MMCDHKPATAVYTTSALVCVVALKSMTQALALELYVYAYLFGLQSVTALTQAPRARAQLHSVGSCSLGLGSAVLSLPHSSAP
eukprot:2802-Heterococcus_DN1.PRE.2